MSARRIELHEVATLAEGGQGTVSLALRAQGTFRRAYAVKRVRAGDARAQARLLQEAQLAGELQHPNVVGVLDLGTDGQGVYLVMDYVFGVSLRDVMASGAKLPPQLALRIAAQVGHALWSAHSLVVEGEQVGLIHRDVSPGNVLLGFDGIVRLADFGLSRTTASATDLGLEGTPGYVAPEQLRRDAVDVRADLFALGVITHELLTGERLFGGPDARSAARRTLEHSPPPLPSSVPEGVRTLVTGLLQVDPRDRPVSSATVTRTLEAGVRELVAEEGYEDLRAFLVGHYGDEIARRRRVMAAHWEELERRTPAPASVRIRLGDGDGEPTRLDLRARRLLLVAVVVVLCGLAYLLGRAS